MRIVARIERHDYIHEDVITAGLIYRLAIEDCAETVDVHGDVNKLYQVPNETHDSKANGDCLRDLHEL